MARKIKKGWFGFGTGKRKTKAQLLRRREITLLWLKAFALIILAAAMAVGLYFLDKKFVKPDIQMGSKLVKIKLLNQPAWLSQDLIRHIYKTAGDSDGWFKLSGTTAGQVYNRLADYSWLYKLKVKTDANQITIDAKYHRPALLIESRNRKVYLAPVKTSDNNDNDNFAAVVLNYQPIYDLSIPVLKGVKLRYMPQAGKFWKQEDARAAMEIINLLELMDKNMADKAAAKGSSFRPLLSEIGSIDVSNFNGRRNRNKPFIVLYSHDQTPIYWGAMEGNLEAVQAEKLATLYQTYKDYGSLQLKSRALAKYIDLTVPRKINPLP